VHKTITAKSDRSFLNGHFFKCSFNIEMWLSLLVSHPKVLKMGQHIVQNKGMTPKREKMRHVKETEDAPE